MKVIVTEYGPWSDWRENKEPAKPVGPLARAYRDIFTSYYSSYSVTFGGGVTLWRSREVRTFVCGFARKSVTEYQSVEAKDGPTALKGLNGEPKTFAYKSKKPKTRSRV